jgi:hypothetical protein
MTLTGSPVSAACCSRSLVRVASALRFSNPVKPSMTHSPRCSISERISATSSIETAMIVATGAITSGGSRRTAWVSVANATAQSSVSAITAPMMTRRSLKREGSVTIGITSHPSVATVGPPVRATARAMMTSEPIHAPRIAYSGRSEEPACRLASLNMKAATISGASVHGPSHGQLSSSASPSTPSALRRAGAIRRSMSSIRSRSMSAPKIHA